MGLFLYKRLAGLNKTITYSYDAGGNITSKTEYAYTTNPANPGTSIASISYAYGDSNWNDKLTSYNGKAITYDAIGNPLIYDGYTYTSQAGRQLAGISGNGKNINYKYNESGIRTEKNVNGAVTKYIINGSDVVYEETENDKIYYTYDHLGKLVSMNLNGVEYYYVRNAQGDIIGLIDGNGKQVVAYTYDSWGKLISIKDGNGNNITNDRTSVGYQNPYRYRGYRYDAETGLYYLQSRYYSPEWGRFINADGIAGQTGELLAHNIFAYCKNNPVNMTDKDGFIPFINNQDDAMYYCLHHTDSVLQNLQDQADTEERKSTISDLKHNSSVEIISVKSNNVSSDSANQQSTIERVDIVIAETGACEAIGLTGGIVGGLGRIGITSNPKLVNIATSILWSIPSIPSVLPGYYTTVKLKYHDENNNVIFANITVGPANSASNGIEEYNTGLDEEGLDYYISHHY